MTTRPNVYLIAALAAGLSACNPAPAPAPEAQATVPATVPAPPPPAVDVTQLALSARASLIPLGDSGVGGELVFAVEDGAVRVTGAITGLAPGTTHAFHIHEFGNCTATDGASAGGHFNPAEAPHGNRATGAEHHAGDIPNQVAGADGVATVDQTLADLQLGGGGELDIIGRGVIVHADADDYTTQPTGNAGGRIACGVIEASTMAPVSAEPTE